MQKRILFLGHSGGMGGAEYSLLRLVGRMKGHFDVEVAAPEGGEFEAAVRERHIPFHPFDPALSLEHILAPQRQLPEFLQRVVEGCDRLEPLVREFDLVHSNTHFCWEGALACAKLQVRHCWNLREVVAHSPTWKPLFGLKGMYHLLFGLSEEVVCNSNTIAKSIEELGDHRPAVIHNGLDSTELPGRQEARRELQERHGIPEDASLLFTIGNFIPEKGHDFLMEFLPELCKAQKNLYLYWPGTHSFTWPRIHALAKDSGIEDRVIAPGSVPNAARLMKAADLYLLPSSTEAFPTVVLEACLAGVSVIARKCGGAEEILQYGGGCSVDSPGEMKSAIRSFYQGHRFPAFSPDGRFDMKSMQESYLSLYRQILSSGVKGNKAALHDLFVHLSAGIEDMQRDRAFLQKLRKTRFVGRLLKTIFS